MNTEDPTTVEIRTYPPRNIGFHGDDTSLLVENGLFDFNEFQRLVIELPDMISEDKRGRRSIHYASLKGKMDELSLLIDNNADIDCEDKDGWRPIHFASINGHLHAVQLLIFQGADINCRNNMNQTCLHLACISQHEDIIRCLLKAGCRTDIVDVNNQTPVQSAKILGHSECAEILDQDEKVKHNIKVFHFENYSVICTEQNYADYSFIWTVAAKTIIPLNRLIIATSGDVLCSEAILKYKVLVPLHSDVFIYPEFVVVNKDDNIEQLIKIVNNCRKWTTKVYFRDNMLEIHPKESIGFLLYQNLLDLELKFTKPFFNFLRRSKWSNFVPVRLKLNNSLCVPMMNLNACVPSHMTVEDFKTLYIDFQKLIQRNPFKLTGLTDDEIMNRFKIILQLRPSTIAFMNDNGETVCNHVLMNDQNTIKNGVLRVVLNRSENIEFLAPLSVSYFKDADIVRLFDKTILIRNVTNEYPPIVACRNHFRNIAILKTALLEHLNCSDELIIMNVSNILEDNNIECLADVYYFVTIAEFRKDGRKECLGKGGFGYVFRYTLEGNSNSYAVKKMHRKCCSHISEKSIVSEIMVALRVGSHPHIMRYHRFYHRNSSFFILMDLMSGCLSTYLKQRKPEPLQEEKILFFSKQILKGLCYLHQCKVIHKDIKGSNILLDDEENVKLSDFGVSKVVSLTIRSPNLTGKHSKAGTANWMAPEVILESEFGLKADIWSFGATLVEMITGNIPYHDLEEPAVFYKIANEKRIEFQRPKHLSTNLFKLVDQCLNPKPSKRPNCSDLLLCSIFQR